MLLLHLLLLIVEELEDLLAERVALDLLQLPLGQGLFPGVVSEVAAPERVVVPLEPDSSYQCICLFPS